MVILGITIISGLVRGKWGLVVANRWTGLQLRKLLLVMVASIGAILVNPFGYHLVLYPLDFVLRQQAIMRGSEYWLPVDFGVWNGKLAMGLILATIAAALFSTRKWRLDEVLLVVFALWSGLSHMRFMDFAAIIIIPILAPRLNLFPPYEAKLDKPWLNAVIIAVILGWVVLSFPAEKKLHEQLASEYPQAALEFMRDRKMTGRVFNAVEFGGYMEWNAPKMKTFIDGRGDIFIDNDTLANYGKIMDLQQSLELLDKYRIDYVLLEPSRPLAYLLEHCLGWRLIYRDQAATLFERTPKG